MSHRYDVAGLGNAIVDIIASVDDRFLLTHKIAKGGMTLIDEFRAKELLKSLADNGQALSGTHEIAGGSAANTMAGIASLGGNGIYVGKVFDDRLGKGVLHRLHQSQCRGGWQELCGTRAGCEALVLYQPP